MTAMNMDMTTATITEGIIITGHTRIDIPMNTDTTGDITGVAGIIVIEITGALIIIVTGDHIDTATIIDGIDTITDNDR
jgi:hypothetical protein